MDRRTAQKERPDNTPAERQLLRETPEQGRKSEITTQNGRVMVIKNVLRDVGTQPYLSFIQKFGFDANLFSKLLNGTFNDWIEICKPATDSVETITVRIGATPDGKKFEGTLTTMYGPSTMKIRLPKSPEESIGFEAILLQKGSIIYDILHGYNQIAEVYTKRIGEEPIRVRLGPGDLLLIPRSVARQVLKVMNNPRYLYIGDPWTDNDKPVEVANSA